MDNLNGSLWCSCRFIKWKIIRVRRVYIHIMNVFFDLIIVKTNADRRNHWSLNIYCCSFGGSIFVTPHINLKRDHGSSTVKDPVDYFFKFISFLQLRLELLLYIADKTHSLICLTVSSTLGCQIWRLNCYKILVSSIIIINSLFFLFCVSAV